MKLNMIDKTPTEDKSVYHVRYHVTYKNNLFTHENRT